MKRKPQELVRASKDLLYEYRMLLHAASFLGQGITAGSPMSNCMLESFLVHLRNLIDFFYIPKNKMDDDCLASDFFEAPNRWRPPQPRLTDPLKSAKRGINKRMVHLSYRRRDVAPYAKEWHVSDLANEIIEAMHAFTDQVDPRLVSPDWSSEDERLRLGELEERASVGAVVGSA
jgi:hypothetical protein